MPNSTSSKSLVERDTLTASLDRSFCNSARGPCTITRLSGDNRPLGFIGTAHGGGYTNFVNSMNDLVMEKGVLGDLDLDLPSRCTHEDGTPLRHPPDALSDVFPISSNCYTSQRFIRISALCLYCSLSDPDSTGTANVLQSTIRRPLKMPASSPYFVSWIVSHALLRTLSVGTAIDHLTEVSRHKHKF